MDYKIKDLMGQETTLYTALSDSIEVYKDGELESLSGTVSNLVDTCVLLCTIVIENGLMKKEQLKTIIGRRYYSIEDENDS